MLNALENEYGEATIPRGRHFILLALIPAFGVSLPYAYLLWDESNRYDVPFLGWDLLVLLGAPFVGYGAAALFDASVTTRLKNKPTLYWLIVSVVGSFLALFVVLSYFYALGNLHLSWKRTLLNAFLMGGGLSVYASAFTGTYFYTVVRRSMKKSRKPKESPEEV
jgi:hypothetical protein